VTFLLSMFKRQTQHINVLKIYILLTFLGMVSNNSKSAKDYLIHVRIRQTIIIKWYKYLLRFFFFERINIYYSKREGGGIWSEM